MKIFKQAFPLPRTLLIYVVLSGVFLAAETIMNFPTAASMTSDRIAVSIFYFVLGVAFAIMLLFRLPGLWELCLTYSAAMLGLLVFSLPDKFFILNLYQTATQEAPPVLFLPFFYCLLKMLLAVIQIFLLWQRQSRAYFGERIFIKAFRILAPRG